MPKVKWEWCTLPKESGDLGIRNIQQDADRLAAKWSIRAMANPKEDWAQLLMWQMDEFSLAGHKKWKKVLVLTILASKYAFNPKGSNLMLSLWKSSNKVKNQLCLAELILGKLKAYMLRTLYGGLSSLYLHQHQNKKT